MIIVKEVNQVLVQVRLYRLAQPQRRLELSLRLRRPANPASAALPTFNGAAPRRHCVSYVHTGSKNSCNSRNSCLRSSTAPATSPADIRAQARCETARTSIILSPPALASPMRRAMPALTEQLPGCSAAAYSTRTSTTRQLPMDIRNSNLCKSSERWIVIPSS